MSMMFKGGAQTFINKGTNGRWRELLNEADLALYEGTMARTLSPDCARWLEQGSAVCPSDAALPRQLPTSAPRAERF